MEQIKGLFEIHITVLNTDIMRLLKYVNNNPEKNLKIVYAISSNGDHPHQLMISKWKSGSALESINSALEISDSMDNFGLSIVRTKVESMASNRGVPQTNEEYENYEKHIINEVNIPYFEYHAKINLNGKTIDDLENTVNYIKSLNISNFRIGVSINAMGSKRLPLLTMRMYYCGFDEAEEIKNMVLDDHIKKSGYTIDGCIQREFSVYDNNKTIDKNWLE